MPPVVALVSRQIASTPKLYKDVTFIPALISTISDAVIFIGIGIVVVPEAVKTEVLPTGIE